MTQVEFDNRMAELNVQEANEYKELNHRMLEVIAQKNVLSSDIGVLKDKKVALSTLYMSLQNEKTEIARKYYNMKAEIRRQNPSAYGCRMERNASFVSKELHGLMHKIKDEMRKICDENGLLDAESVVVSFHVDDAGVRYECTVKKAGTAGGGL